MKLRRHFVQRAGKDVMKCAPTLRQHRKKDYEGIQSSMNQN